MGTKMDQDSLNNHYKNLAKNYDEAFAELKPDKRKAKNSFDFGGEEGARVIAELLKLKEEDHFVDLGAGTCRTAGMVAKIVSLKQPVLCVDPVQEMLDVGKKNKIDNIETLCATAEEFVKEDLKYDKMLIKGTGAPFFRQGIDIRNSIQSGLTDLLENLLKDLAFTVNIKRFEEHMNITKVEAIKSIQNRSLSCLSALSDEEIAKGIAEVEREFDEIIDYKTVWEMIVAQK